MNYGEIKHNLISLGFAEETDYEEFEDLGYTFDAINRAIVQIGKHFPYEATYEFEIDDTDDGILYIDMSARNGFLGFSETPVVFEKDGEEIFRKFADYDIEKKNTIVIDASKHKGSFRIYYKALCTQIDVSTSDTFVPEIPLKAHYLIPLLASYYLWLDDDERKAVMYQNMYDSELANLLAEENQPRLKVKKESAWGCLQ